MYLLKNKQVLISGGGGRTGLELALFFGKSGSKIILVDEDHELLEKASQVLASFDINVRIYHVDIVSEMAASQLAAELQKTGKPVDILINAACLDLLKSGDRNNGDGWKRQTEIVLKGSRNTIKYFSMNMEKGLIVNIVPYPEWSSASGATLYSSLKTGLNALTTVWARELGSNGNRVNTLIPGFLEEFEMGTVQSLDNLKEKIPAGRLGTIQDIASVISFLSSQQATYITGASIPVDGGYFS
jgi:gluconate 5-dehydrogenase